MRLYEGDDGQLFSVASCMSHIARDALTLHSQPLR